MIQNRTIPYGYVREMGELKTHPTESEVIREIYRKYADGDSYKKIADSLTERNVQYLENKSIWNKNMIARILQNQKYLGTEGYPQIITEHIKSKSTLAQKPYTHTMNKAIKALKPLMICGVCGGKIQRKLKTGYKERWRCENDLKHISVNLTDVYLENLLIAFIKAKLQGYKFAKSTVPKPNIEIIRLQERIERQIEMHEIDINEVQMNITKLAELKYSVLENTTHLLEKSLANLLNAPNENLEELKNIAKAITLSQAQIISITMVDMVTL